MDEQSELGRHVDDGTMEWWGRQKKEIQDEAFGDHERTSVMDAIKQLNKFSVGVDEFWCQGPLFDYAILQHLYKQMETSVSWNYWQIRDSQNSIQYDATRSQKRNANRFTQCFG